MHELATDTREKCRSEDYAQCTSLANRSSCRGFYGDHKVGVNSLDYVFSGQSRSLLFDERVPEKVKMCRN